MTTLDKRDWLNRAIEPSSTDRRTLWTARSEFDQQDDVEAHLSQAQELIAKAMSGRHDGIRHMRYPADDDESILAVAGEMMTTARHEILFVMSPDDVPAGHRHRMLGLLQDARRRGLKVKALVPQDLALSGVALVREMGSHPGYRARDVLGQNLLITDGREAAAWTVWQKQPGEILLVSVAPLAHLLRDMFDLTWSFAVPLAEVLGINAGLQSAMTQSILGSLCAGEKDEVAARKLGMSVRTYRRHVANIMRDMRANSRFQAGVRANELGLISGP